MHHSTERYMRLSTIALLVSSSHAMVATSAADAGRQVAAWCVAADRAEATVAVSSATTLPGVLHDFWHCSRMFAAEDGKPGRQRVLAFPYALEDGALFSRVMQHIGSCADICEYFGESMLVAGRHPNAPTSADEPEAAPVPMMIVRSFVQKEWGDFSSENRGEDDPFAVMADHGEYMDEAAKVDDAANEQEVISCTAAWVGGLATQLGLGGDDGSVVDPFLAGVAYPLTDATSGEEMYESFWASVVELTEKTEARTHAASVLVAPRFSRYNANGFEFFQESLNTALIDGVFMGEDGGSRCGIGLGDDVQLTFYHPAYTVTDDDVARGVDFARASPFPMVSLLRTWMVEQARAEGSVEVMGSTYMQALTEVHERIAGPEGGLIPLSR